MSDPCVPFHPINQTPRQGTYSGVIGSLRSLASFQWISYGPVPSLKGSEPGHFEGGFKWCHNGFLRIPNLGPIPRDHGIYFGLLGDVQQSLLDHTRACAG